MRVQSDHSDEIQTDRILYSASCCRNEPFDRGKLTNLKQKRTACVCDETETASKTQPRRWRRRNTPPSKPSPGSSMSQPSGSGTGVTTMLLIQDA